MTQPNHPELSPKITPEKQPPATHKTQKMKPPKLLFIMALLALTAAVLNTLYLLETHQQSTQRTHLQTSALLMQIKTLREQTTQEKNQWEHRISQLEQSQKTDHDALEANQQKIHAALKENHYQTEDWLLLKARYCLELAALNAQWSHDRTSTSALLTEADTILNQIKEPATLAIRQALAKEIAAANAIPKLDIVHLLSQLDAASDAITQLPLKTLSIEKNPKTSLVIINPSTWQERLKQNAELIFEKLVVIRRHNDETDSLPSPLHEAVLRDNLRLQLQRAQWAVLQENDAVYQLSLAHVIATIPQLFQAHSDATNAVLKQLNALQETHITEQKPTLGHALSLLNQQIEPTGVLSR